MTLGWRARAACAFVGALGVAGMHAPDARAQDAGAQDAGTPDEWGAGDGAFDFDVPAAALEAPPPPRDWSLTGFLRSDWGLWAERLDDQPFAKGRQSLDVDLGYVHGPWRVKVAEHVEYDLAYTVDADAYDDPTIDAYRFRALSGEQLVGFAAGPVEITVGRQIVAWGEGDVLSPLDVVNPRDNREPGLADLDDLRLSVLATRVGWFEGSHRVEAMVLHESYFGERAPPLAPFSPFRALLASDPAAAALIAGKSFDYQHVQDRFALDQQEPMLRWVYKGAGLDAGLYVASVLDDQGVVVLPTLLSLLAKDDIDIALDHRRYTATGLSAATSFGDFVMKWEVAAEIGRPYNTGDTSATVPVLDVAEVDTLTAMSGLAWSGVTDLTLAAEVQRGFGLDPPADLLVPLNLPVGALRLSYRALRDRLTLNAAATSLGLRAQYGWLARAEATYEILDGFKAGVGFVHYGPGDEGKFGPFTGFDDHDRAFAKLRWDFVVY